jgi:hypothetical protein
MPQPSFTLAAGDPDALFAAAGWHQNVADGLTAHAGTIRAAAGSASAFWQGEAASAYQSLSSVMAFGFETTAAKSADAATIYRRLAAEVERCQQEGRAALRQAQHWCDQVITDNQRVTTAQGEVTTALQDVDNAQQELTSAASSPDANVNARVPGAQAALGAAQDRLHLAQGQLRTAQHDLDHANQELARWDRRGEQAFQEAERAVAMVTGLPLSIDPPPMPGLVTGPVSPLTQRPPAGLAHPGGGGFWHDVLGAIQDGATVVAAGGGICAATMFWNGIGEVCGVASGAASGVSALDGVAQAATGNGSVGAAALDTVGAVGSAGSLKLGEVGAGLIEDGKGVSGSAGAVIKNRGATYKAVGGVLSGTGGTASAGSAASSVGHHR